MQNSVGRSGLLMAGLLVAAFLAYVVLGNRHESWFLQVARESAVRCLTGPRCAFLAADGRIIPATAPRLSSGSACARPEAWRQLEEKSAASQRIVLTCTDGKTYLYHIGKIGRPEAGSEQWTTCAEPSCVTELRLLAAAR
jgi:hypothetical protein